MATEESSWRTANFRQSVVAKIEEAIRSSGMPTTKNSMEMENHVFQKAKTKEEYLGFVARLILHVREMNSKKSSGIGGPAGAGGQNMQDPINALQTLARQGTGNQMMGLVPPQGPNQVTATNLLQTLNQRPGNQQRMQSPVQKKKANSCKTCETDSTLQDFMKNIFGTRIFGKVSAENERPPATEAQEDKIDGPEPQNSTEENVEDFIKQEILDFPTSDPSTSTNEVQFESQPNLNKKRKLGLEKEELPSTSTATTTTSTATVEINGDSHLIIPSRLGNKNEQLEMKRKKSKLELEIMEKTSYERSLSILKLERELGIAPSKYSRDLLWL